MEILVILIIIIRREFYHIIRIFFYCFHVQEYSWFMSSIRQFYHLIDITVSSPPEMFLIMFTWLSWLISSTVTQCQAWHCPVIFVSQFSHYYDLRAEIWDNRIPSYRTVTQNNWLVINLTWFGLKYSTQVVGNLKTYSGLTSFAIT